MKRKLLGLILVIMMIMAVFPGGLMAVDPPEIQDALDFTLPEDDPGYPGDSGDGWAWDAAAKTLTLDGVNIAADDYFAVKLPDGAGIVLQEGSENYIANEYNLGIQCVGDLQISGRGNLTINTEGTAIRVAGDLTVQGVGILSIDGDYNGIRVGPGGETTSDSAGNVDIINCDTIDISVYYSGIRATGNLTVDGVGALKIENERYNGIRVGAGSSAHGRSSSEEGDVIITNCGTVSIDAYNHAIRNTGNLIIDGITLLDIESANRTGIRVGPGYETEGDAPGNAELKNIGRAVVKGSNHGIRAVGNLILKGINNLEIDAGNSGLRVGSGYGAESDAAGSVSIIDCNSVSIEGVNNGIRNLGDVVISNCPDISITSTGESHIYGRHGIYTTHGGVTIIKSALEVYGANFGIATGPVCGYSDEAAGGDIIIEESFVDASCSPDGFAAIFAGDNVPFGDPGHSRIHLERAVIITPEGGIIMDVDIEDEFNNVFQCQSITAVEEIDVITQWEQAANTVLIEPLYTVTYNSNGGTGTMTDPHSPYNVEAEVTVLENSFTRADYEFTGWKTTSGGSGTSYAPGDTFTITRNITLYAQWGSLDPVVEQPIEEEEEVDKVEDITTIPEDRELPQTGGTAYYGFGLLLLAGGAFLKKIKR